MPHISIKMYPGRTEEIKKNLAAKVEETVMKELNMESKYISVSVEEIEKDKWQEEVVEKLNPEEVYVESNF